MFRFDDGRKAWLLLLSLAFFLGVTAGPARAQDTQAPRPILLPPPPDNVPDPLSTPVKTKAKPAAKPAPASAPAKTTPASTPAAKPAVVTSAPPKPTPVATPVATPVPSVQPTPPPPTQTQTPAPVPVVPVSQPAAVPDTAQAPVTGLADGASTFGFFSGETKEQIITAIGKENLLKTDGDILEVAAAPKPDPNFDSFLLIVAPKQGLVKLIASGKDIEGDAAGRQMRAQFGAMKTDLSKAYGDPSDNFDFLDAKSTLKGQNNFMISLTKTERTLSAYWTKKDFGNAITSIEIEGNGLGNEKGYLSLEYEFSGYHAYLLSRAK